MYTDCISIDFFLSLFRLDCTAYRCTLCHLCGDYFGARSGMCCVWGWTQHCTTSISSALVPCSSLCSSSCYPPHCSITLSLQPWVSIFTVCIACKYSFGVEWKESHCSCLAFLNALFFYFIFLLQFWFHFIFFIFLIDVLWSTCICLLSWWLL